MLSSWGSDNTIVYGVYGASPGSAIMRISANGGTPEALVKGKSWILIAPQILPDGKSVLYSAQESTAYTKIMVQTLKSEKPKELFAGIAARYLPTGHLVYGLADKLYAVLLDIDRLEVSGLPVPMVEGVMQAAFSDSGTMVYMPATATAVAPGRTLVWVGRNGKEEPLAAPPNMYRFPNISPDGTRVALAIEAGGNSDIWIWNLVRRNLTRLTFDGKRNIMPVWTPEGKRIAFYSERSPAGNWGGVYWKPADGAGEDENLGLFGDQAFMPSC